MDFLSNLFGWEEEKKEQIREVIYVDECKPIIGKMPLYGDVERERDMWGTCTEIALTYDNNQTPQEVIHFINTSCIVGREKYLSNEQIGEEDHIIGQDCHRAAIASQGRVFFWEPYGYTECIQFDQESFGCVVEGQGDRNGKLDEGEGIDYKRWEDFSQEESTVTQNSHTRVIG